MSVARPVTVSAKAFDQHSTLTSDDAHAGDDAGGDDVSRIVDRDLLLLSDFRLR